LNLRTENRTWNFGAIQRSASAGWSRLLNRIQATGGTLADEQVFYTALYHALLHPNIFDDVNGEYIGFDHRIHRARGYTQYANFSGWDIYRTEVQLLALVAPRETSDMMQSLVADASQSGWLPRWPMANDETGEMNGDSADPIVADAMAFGARHFDLHAALRYMIKGSTQMGQGTRGYVERPGISQYLRLGFAPPRTTGIYGSAATTLEYSVDDFAIGQMVAMLGDRATYVKYMRRSQGWRHLFNPATGFVEPALPDGSFPAAFNPSSMDGFVEGDSWQYSWMVPHNLRALFRVMGGNRQVTRRLDRFFTQLNTGPNTPYDWAGNEPGLEVPWEYDFAGQPWRTQAVVRRILTQLYLPKPWGLPGNDDLGTMSAWCVWAAMGFYPEIPGVADLVLGSPLFPRITVHLPGGHDLTLSAPRAASSPPYIQRVRLNGRLYSKPWLPPSSWEHGAVLQFTLGSTPNKAWGSARVDAPPSFSSR
jgi:predicted alpha-1,2-mannosidase